MSLDQETAVFRHGLIQPGSITYNIHLILQPNQYYGLAEINFYIQHLDFTHLEVDFSGFLIEEVVANSHKFMPKTTDNFIILPKAYLQRGRNKLSVMYINKYNLDREGCITFKDQGLQFIYTDFQPYAAHRVFPCFDQPDLKANMKISIVTPPDWVALSNNPPFMTQKINPQIYKQRSQFQHSASNKLLDSFLSKLGEEEVNMTLFDYTELLSTYVYSFAAGPWTFIEADEGKTSVPMKLYCVPSSILMLDSYSEFIFDVTQKALTYFESFFVEPFPFKKYDQIFVRDYANWAMENAGLVTYNEQKMLQPYSTEDDYYNFADTIVHELSHHWFGNLVTMKWWDDLWLNESFADFIAQFALTKINSNLIHTLQPPAMYFRDRKSWGYQDDERNSSTHPIRGEVKDTDVAASIFDGITYAKGAAVIKQLVFLVGQNNFSRGLQSYFDRFKWSNATITDFLEDMQPYLPVQIDLEEWMRSWLETSSLNIFQSIWDPEDLAPTATLRLYQSAFSSDYDTLRWHKMQVAFFNANGAVVQTKTAFVPSTTNLHEITYDGSNSVKAILVNQNDHSFLQNYMDPTSLKFFMQNINKIGDTFTRSLVWYSIAQLNKLGLMKIQTYVGFIASKLFDQPSNFIISQILTQLQDFLNNFINSDEKQIHTETIFQILYSKLQDFGITDPDRITILEKFYIRYAHLDTQIVQLKDWLMGQDATLQARQIFDETLPWDIVKKVFSVSDALLTVEQKEEAFTYWQQLDNGERAEQSRKVCDTILCTKQQFDSIYTRFKQPFDDLSTREQLIAGWRNRYHEEWVSALNDQIFTDMVEVSSILPYAFFEFFYLNVRPLDTDFASQVAKYSNVIDQLMVKPQMDAHVNNLKKIVDDLSLNLSLNNFNAESEMTLSQVRAQDRYSSIRAGSISYISHVAMVALNESRSYTSLTQINFELTSIPQMLPIDFKTNTVIDLIVNGFNVSATLWGEYLMVPRVYLQLGINTVAIHYQNQYDNDGLGCLSYIDLSTNPPQYYTYTQFQPHSCHRFIPCFDQPDLKATFSLNVIVPAGWTAVSNEIVSYQGVFDATDYIAHAPQQTDKFLLPEYLANKSGYFYIFNKTNPLPTYLYALVAGQYISVQLPVEQRLRNIPMKIYSLASYQTALDSNKDFIFEITLLALKFYQAKFGVQYQFSKYDTAFCHQFSAGAMENPGIITFNDTYLYQETVSVEKMLQLGVVIAHQCAHNWFGNYVTMKWWDDLWLNQSFADFMAYYCIDGIKADVTSITYTTGWLGGLERTVSGFREDQMSTTHPIRPDMPNTNLAKMYFDGITYRKGLMVLKQLIFNMTDTQFFKGVTDYFNNLGWSNGTIDDFIASIAPYYVPLDPQYTLDIWKNTWLLTPSLNSLAVTWSPNNTSVDSTLTVTQTNYSATYPQLRYHRINIAFFDATGNVTFKPVLIGNKASSVVTYDGSPGIKAVLLNYNLQDFVKVTIDNTSYTWFSANINLVQDPLTRMIIWFYMNEMVRDSKKKLIAYRDVVLSRIVDEPQDAIYDFQLKFLNSSTGSYLSISQRPSARSPIFTFVLQQLTSIALKQKIKNPIVSQKSGTRMLSWINSMQLFKTICKNQKKIVRTLTDAVNRAKILQDNLPVFCSSDTQLDILEKWRKGSYVDLNTHPITVSQAFAVVKLIYASDKYTNDERTVIYDDQNTKSPGILSALTLNTLLALEVTDLDIYNFFYETFIEQNESITVKSSFAEGWNSSKHLDWLVNIYKQKIFQEIPGLSKVLSAEHFKFFYSGLAPIDDDLAVTISLYEAVSLKGSDMLGHMNNIKKIVDGYKLRQGLYTFNQ